MISITAKKQDSILINHENLTDIIGFDLVPVINSSNASRSIGAKISTLVENHINKYYNVRSGDEIYKINNELMRMAPFHKIQQKLKELISLEGSPSPIFITLERGSLINSVPSPKPESILKLHNKLHPVSSSISSSSSTSETTTKRVVFDSKPDVCMYQEDRSDHAITSAIEQGDDHSSVNNSCVSSDLGDDRFVHSIFSSYLKQERYWKQDILSETSSDHSWTTSNQDYNQSLEVDTQAISGNNAQTSCEQQIPMTTIAQASSFVPPPPPQDQYPYKIHEERANPIDTWSYSTASSPVGLSILEECEGKSYFSSPGSGSLSHKQSFPTFGDIPCTKDTDIQKLKPTEIPFVIYKPENCGKTSSEDGSVSTVYMSPLSMQPELTSLIQVRDTLHEDLEGKVSTMRRAVQSLERQIFNQSREARNKISTLESSQRLAENEITRLESICVSSSNEAREIRRLLQTKQNELDRFKDSIDRERMILKAEVAKLEELNSDLRVQVDNLSKQLDIQKNKTANARQLAEMELRQSFQAASNEDKALISELCSELKKATLELEEMMSVNEQLTRKIHDLESVSSICLLYLFLFPQLTNRPYQIFVNSYLETDEWKECIPSNFF